MERIQILGVSIGIDSFTGQYRAIFTHPGGRIFRRLGITPSPGVASFAEEKPEVVMRVVTASNIISNELGDEGAFSSRGRYLFKDAMEEFLIWHEGHRNNPGIRNQAKSSH